MLLYWKVDYETVTAIEDERLPDLKQVFIEQRIQDAETYAQITEALFWSLYFNHIDNYVYNRTLKQFQMDEVFQQEQFWSVIEYLDSRISQNQNNVINASDLDLLVSD